MVAHFLVHVLFLLSLLVIVSSIVETFAPFLQLFGISSVLVTQTWVHLSTCGTAQLSQYLCIFWMLKSTVFSSMDSTMFLGSESPSSVLITILVYFFSLTCGLGFFLLFFDSAIVTSNQPFFFLLAPSCCQTVVWRGHIYHYYSDSETLQVDCLKDARSLWPMIWRHLSVPVESYIHRSQDLFVACSLGVVFTWL